jgi:serine/threonine protein kinase
MSSVVIKTRKPTSPGGEDSSYSEEDKKNNIINYITYDQLLRRYPRDKASPTSSGTYGDVYRSGEYAVKIFRDDVGLNNITKELNIYSSIDHPCIIKPICWSVDEERGISFLVMPLGMDIKVAYNGGAIGIMKIIEDLLSAISFLNENGIAHCDIKPGNVIFHDGRAKLIDMGIIKYATLNSDGQYYISGEAYSPYWMDPEYSFNQYNRINSEVYAIGATVMEIYSKMDSEFAGVYHYAKQMKKPSPLRDFIRRAILPANERPSAINLGVSLGLDLTPGTLKQQDIALNIPIKRDIVERFIITHRAFNLSMETFFLSLKLMQQTSNIFEDEENILYIAVLTDLANDVTTNMIIGPRNFQGMFEWADNMSLEDFTLIYRKKKIQTLEYLGGTVYSKTLWNCAKSSEDLLPLLRSIMNGETEGVKFVTGHSKCVNVDDLIGEDEIHNYLKVKKGKKEELSPLEINSCNLDTEADIDILNHLLVEEKDWEELSPWQTLPIFIHNRAVLYQLELEPAVKLYQGLLGGFPNAYLSSLTLDKICNYNWKKYAPMIIRENLHPFDPKWTGK